MPFRNTDEMPERVRSKLEGMSQEAKQAALDALNGCLYQEGSPDEERCFRVAIAAAQRHSAGERGGPPRQGGAGAPRRNGGGERRA